ncbi:MAG: prepilin-type N-terminal cleavage/methylation domain-containing protein [Candidatus Dormibacteria bacterium]|jgi:prepilin-type N-terminal cleavage/methylation domain-containing protein
MITPTGRRDSARSIRRRRSGQAGLTLIEMVVTLAIISIGVVGIAYGFSAAVRSAGYAQVQAELDAAAQSAAGYVQTIDSYQPCATTTTYALPAPPPEITSSVTQVSESNSASNPGYTGSGCGGQVADYGVQEITITVSDGSDSVIRAVWKGDSS